MIRRVLQPVVALSVALTFMAVRTALAQDESSTTLPDVRTTAILEPTTIPDDNYTLFPDWSNDGFDYLNPDPATRTDGLPGTGRDLGVLAGASAIAIVAGAGISFGARSRARRR